MSNVVALDGVLLDESSINKDIITLSIPITASNSWNDISQMQSIESGVYAFTFTGVYNTGMSWQNDGTYGGIFYWKPNKACNTEEYSTVPFTYVSHATNNEKLNFRIHMPRNSNYAEFQIYTPFTNSSSLTGTMKLRKLL